VVLAAEQPPPCGTAAVCTLLLLMELGALICTPAVRAAPVPRAGFPALPRAEFLSDQKGRAGKRSSMLEQCVMGLHRRQALALNCNAARAGRGMWNAAWRSPTARPPPPPPPPTPTPPPPPTPPHTPHPPPPPPHRARHYAAADLSLSTDTARADARSLRLHGSWNTT
jgi:hypothetical protein